MYKPLPNSLTLKNSEIHGVGIFATEDIPSDTILGITHIIDDRFEQEHIRTPLGGFYNHSTDPNCETYYIDDIMILRTIRNITSGEEITSKYKLYFPSPL